MNSPPLSDDTTPTVNISGKRKRSRFYSTPEPCLYNQNVMQNVVVKKQKACLNCRRSKLKCVVDEEHGGACVRCLTRSEECRFKSRTHDEEWQEMTSNRLDDLSRAIEELSYSMNLIMPHLSLNAPSMEPLPPQVRPPQRYVSMQRSPEKIPTTVSYTPMSKDMPVMQPWLSPPMSLDENFSSPSQHSYSTPSSSVYNDNCIVFGSSPVAPD
ncbi:hypothetical protein BS47DRAFT_1343075, partial [Hydnum rufescens UP504]